MTLQSEIMDGLNVPGWDASIAAVKRVVGNALRQLDRAAEVKDTTYFNHSFVPDFVVTWPREQGRSRDVFLRVDSSDAFLAGDLHYLGETRPMLLGLTALEGPATSADSPSLLATEAGHTLITEPEAVEELTTQRTSNTFGQVMPAALLKGGRGIVEAPTATAITSASEAFFAAAQTHESVAVQSAVPALTEYLEPSQASRVLHFGRIVWEATGGEAAAFPIATDLGGLDDAGLAFLLSEAPVDDAAFWRSVGRTVSLDRLVGLGVRTAPNLASLVRANADRLYARALAVKASQRRLDERGPEWTVEAGGLAFTGEDFVAYLTPARGDLTIKPDAAPGLDFASFRDRMSDEQIETVTVRTTDGKIVAISSEEMFDPSTDSTLASLGAMPGAVINSVGIIVSGKHLECEFVSRVASGHTSAQFEILALLERGLPMLWPLTDDRDVAELHLLRRATELSRPASLFDDPTDA